MKTRTLAALACALAGCTSTQAVREGATAQAGTKVEISSSRPATEFAACIQEKWGLKDPNVSTTPFQGGTNVRTTWRDTIVAQADVLPAESGSIATFTTPYAAQGHNYLPQMRECAQPP